MDTVRQGKHHPLEMPHLNRKLVCAGDGIPVEMSDYLKWVDTRNSALTSKWTITPEVGWSWKGGDRENTDFPGILFNDNGHYELKDRKSVV